MTPEEAGIILKFHRPDRPRCVEKRNLQQAVDLAIAVMEAYQNLQHIYRPKGKWVKTEEYPCACENCGMEPTTAVERPPFARGVERICGEACEDGK